VFAHLIDQLFNSRTVHRPPVRPPAALCVRPLRLGLGCPAPSVKAKPQAVASASPDPLRMSM